MCGEMERRRCGGGSQEGSRQLSWAQALSCNLFTALHFSAAFWHPPSWNPTQTCLLLSLLSSFSLLSSLHHSHTGLWSLYLVFFSSLHHFSSLQLISPHFHSLFHFVTIFFFSSDFSHHGADRPAQHCLASQFCPTKCLPVRHLSLWALSQTDSSPSLLLAQTSHGNRPLVETLPTLCFHPSSHTICSRLMSYHGVDEQAVTTAACFICHMYNHEDIRSVVSIL